MNFKNDAKLIELEKFCKKFDLKIWSCLFNFKKVTNFADQIAKNKKDK